MGDVSDVRRYAAGWHLSRAVCEAMSEAVLLALLTAYSKTIDLIVSIRADMPESERRKEWQRHFDRVQFWEDFVQQAIKAAAGGTVSR
jgi:hypothetical protein